MAWTLTDLSQELEKRGWKLPSYHLPYTSSETPDGPLAMRVVIRQDLSYDKLTILHRDIAKAISNLDARGKHVNMQNANIQQLLQVDRAHYAYIGSRGC